MADHVLPDVPIRQWVLSVPFELRVLLAAKPDALSAVGRIFVQEVHRWQRAATSTHESSKATPEKSERCGAILFPQRFGGSLNLNVHYHVVAPDALFRVDDGGRERAHVIEHSAPSRVDLEDIVHNTACRVISWLKRKGYVRDDSNDDETSDEGVSSASALSACLQRALGIGELHTLKQGEPTTSAAELKSPKRPRGGAVEAYGFNLHAGVRVAAGNPDARERLLRYCARAPLSLERLCQSDEGSIVYQMRHGNKARVMTPMQFMARLAALIPPPRHPLIRFHGVFAPHSRFREQVVPPSSPPSAEEPTCPPTTASTQPQHVGDFDKQTDPAELSPPREPNAPASDDTAAVATSPELALRPRRPGTSAVNPQKQTGQLLSPSAYNERQPRSRIDWATLLRRVYTIDALECPKCKGRMRFTDLFDDKQCARKELEQRGISSEPPPLARARSPDYAIN